MYFSTFVSWGCCWGWRCMCCRGRVKLKPCAGQSRTDHRQTLPQAELRRSLLLPLLGSRTYDLFWDLSIVLGLCERVCRNLPLSRAVLLLPLLGCASGHISKCVNSCEGWLLTWCRTHQEDQPASAMWEFPQPLFLQVNMNLVASFCKNLEIHNI